MRFTDGWEEGEEFLKTRRSLMEVKLKKEELEKEKKQLNAKIRKNKSETEGNKGKSPSNDSNFKNPNCLPDPEYAKQLLSFNITNLGKEEARLTQQLEALEIEKSIFLIEYKRIMEEERCKLIPGGVRGRDKPVVLGDKYLILSLMGKGGYSEVYRVKHNLNKHQAFDLEDLQEVACKIHEFDPQWNESMKANYIKHAIRENETHKELVDPRVILFFSSYR